MWRQLWVTTGLLGSFRQLFVVTALLFTDDRSNQGSGQGAR